MGGDTVHAKAGRRVLVVIVGPLVGLIGGIIGGAVISLVVTAISGGVRSGDFSLLLLGIPFGALSGIIAGLGTALLGVRTRYAWEWALISTLAILAVFGPIHSWNLLPFIPVILAPIGATWLAASAVRWLLAKWLPEGPLQAWMILVFAVAVFLLAQGWKLIIAGVVSLY